MILATVLRVLILLPTFWAVYWMWAAVGRKPGWIGIVSTAGFLIRCVAGLILFWISYLDLPLGSHLQVGDGIWFFALDAKPYMAEASAVASSGAGGIVFMTRTAGSFFYVQILALFVLLFGPVASTGLLLNLFCYLATCLPIAWWGDRTQNPKVATIAVGALAFSPSGVLWSLQPLKDSLFIFLVVAFAALAMEWQVTSRSSTERRWIPLTRTAALMCIVLFGIAGIRWYFAFVTWIACAIFLFLVAFDAPRRPPAFLSGLVMTALLGQAVVIGSGDFISPTIRRALSWRSASAVWEVAPTVIDQMESSREGFDRVGGATLIRPGPAAIRGGETSLPVASVRPPISAAPRAEKSSGVLARAEPPSPVPAAHDRASPPTRPDVNDRLQRLISGAAAVLLPRALAQRLGLIEVGGGRGFWLFVEIDTIAFDLILAVAVIYTLRSIRRSFRSPVFWHVVLMTVLIAVPLIYTVSNFGTLFRHRSMIYVGLALIPLAVASSSEGGRRLKRDIAP